MGPDVKLRWVILGLVCKNNPRTQISDFSPNECCLLLCTSHWVCLQVGNIFFEKCWCFLSKSCIFRVSNPEWSNRTNPIEIHDNRSETSGFFILRCGSVWARTCRDQSPSPHSHTKDPRHRWLWEFRSSMPPLSTTNGWCLLPNTYESRGQSTETLNKCIQFLASSRVGNSDVIYSKPLEMQLTLPDVSSALYDRDPALNLKHWTA